MNNPNDNAIRVLKLFREHLAGEQTLDGIDAETSRLEAEVARNDARAARVNKRQDEIAAELRPALTEVGAVTWEERGVTRLVRLNSNGEVVIEEVKSWGHLATAMRPTRMFTDEAIVEAAKHAAIVGEFPHPGDDDTGEYDAIPLSDGDTIRLPFQGYIARNDGRQATIVNGVAVIDQEAG